jgi:hypothetical protein
MGDSFIIVPRPFAEVGRGEGLIEYQAALEQTLRIPQAQRFILIQQPARKLKFHEFNTRAARPSSGAMRG